MNQVIDVTQDDVTVISENTVNEHAHKLGTLATQLGYKGALTVGALEDEIRFYQQRTVEAFFEMGKRLILLKEMTPHGEFVKRLEMLGFSKSSAQRLMSASYKLSKLPNLGHLVQIGNTSKLLEFLTLDDDEIGELAETGSVLGIELDEYDKMTASELRKALREAKSDNQAKENIIKKKDEKLNELDAELTKLQAPAKVKEKAETAKQQLSQSALSEIQSATLTLFNDIARFTNRCQAVAETIEEHGLYHLQEQYETSIVASFQQIAELSTTLGVQIDFENMVTPAWLQAEQGN
ncbi:DUF3102 domain-containing protein [Moraxella equi]|uniref:DUF3102 domain-containing protein n=1 Tax=Moraxella equi TaxID=60442 RepID=A0A378QPQ0_9GAMM|nr:DUF3102 domain-containing protein [Moraxella equi]OPH34986.1 hypothetical protein B5J93_11555 [Moraxella equi]STZ02869.1 Uncharacterised protein [Moraxella equi]